MSQSVSSNRPSFSPHSPPYTVDLRPLSTGVQSSFVWQPTAPIALVDADTAFEFEGSADLRFTKTIKGFDLTGELTGKALVPCSQCVGETWVEETFTIAESFLLERSESAAFEEKAPPPKHGSKLELHPQDFDEPVDAMQPFALGELLRQVILTQLPGSAKCSVTPIEACPSFG